MEPNPTRGSEPSRRIRQTSRATQCQCSGTRLQKGQRADKNSQSASSFSTASALHFPAASDQVLDQAIAMITLDLDVASDDRTA